MKQKISAARLTLWVSWFAALLVAVLAVFLPRLLDWYCRFRSLTKDEYRAILIAYYCCVVVLEWAMWDMDRLLRNILAGKVFVRGNVKRIRALRRHCGVIALICLPAAIVYMPLLFVVIIMAFLCLVVSVVAQMMGAAVELREENDLTI